MKITIKNFRRHEYPDMYLINFIKKRSDFKLNNIGMDSIEYRSRNGINNRINSLLVPGTSNILSSIIISEIEFIPVFNTELFIQYKEFMENLFGEINIPLSFSMTNEDKHYFISIVIPEYEGRLAYSKIFRDSGKACYFEDRLKSFFTKNIQKEFKISSRDIPELDTAVDVTREKTVEERHDENADYVFQMLFENKFDDEENDDDRFNFDNVEIPEEDKKDVAVSKSLPEHDDWDFNKYDDEEYKGDEGFDDLDELDNSNQYEEISIPASKSKKSRTETALKVLDVTCKVVFIAIILRKLIKRK